MISDSTELSEVGSELTVELTVELSCTGASAEDSLLLSAETTLSAADVSDTVEKLGGK